MPIKFSFPRRGRALVIALIVVSGLSCAALQRQIERVLDDAVVGSLEIAAALAHFRVDRGCWPDDLDELNRFAAARPMDGLRYDPSRYRWAAFAPRTDGGLTVRFATRRSNLEATLTLSPETVRRLDAMRQQLKRAVERSRHADRDVGNAGRVVRPDEPRLPGPAPGKVEDALVDHVQGDALLRPGRVIDEEPAAHTCAVRECGVALEQELVERSDRRRC